MYAYYGNFNAIYFSFCSKLFTDKEPDIPEEVDLTELTFSRHAAVAVPREEDDGLPVSGNNDIYQTHDMDLGETHKLFYAKLI